MSLNLIAHSYGNTYLQADDEVLITVAEHHANIVPWHLLGERVGSRTIAAPVNPDGSFDLEVFKPISPSAQKLSLFRMSLMFWERFSRFGKLPRWRMKTGLFVWWMAVRVLPICLWMLRLWGVIFTCFQGISSMGLAALVFAGAARNSGSICRLFWVAGI